MREIAICSMMSVLKLVLVVLAGIWLGRRGILNREGRHSLSAIVIHVMLPCLLLVSLGRNANASNLGKWSILVVAAFMYAFGGFGLGVLACHLFRIPLGIRRVVSTASAFGNASFLPLPLMATVCVTAPLLSGDPGAGERSFAYISVFLLCHSPLLWLFGYTYLSGRSWREIHWHQIVTPPLIASFSGMLLGVIPPLHGLFFGEGAPLWILTSTCEMVSHAVFPCALLVLGANLAEKLPEGERVPVRAYVALTLTRLAVMPLIGFGFTCLAFHAGWALRDPVFLLVMMVEASVPPATNLVIMTQVHKHGEAAMARLLLCAYCMTVPMLTLSMMFFLYMVGGWLA